MNRDRAVRLVFLTIVFCLCGISFSFAQELKLTPEYYHIKDFKFQSGMMIEDLKIEYATLGTPKKDSQGDVSNAVVFCHGFSGNYAQIALLKGMVGPGKPFDTDKYFFILPTAIGSPGSSCPSVSGLGPKFPKYTVADMISSQYLLVTEHLNIKHLAGVAGASMGGFQTLQWITMYPDFMDWAIPIATSSKTIGRLLGRSAALVDIIKLDPAYQNGYYKEQPKKGMEVYFMAAYLWYFAHDYYAQKWKTKEELLKGLKDVGLGSAKADANDTVWREEALMNYDVEELLPSVKAKTLVIGVNDDELFPPSSIKAIAIAIPGAKVFSYDSILGHLGCALHLTKASNVITDFLK
jgi:homoserine O-acetyltransferase